MRSRRPQAHRGSQVTEPVATEPGKTRRRPERGHIMSATTVPAPTTTGLNWALAVRIGLIALAVIVIFAASFALGRATVSSSKAAPAVAPVSSVPFNAGASTDEPCRMGRAC